MFGDPDSLLAELLRYQNLPPREFARALETSTELEELYAQAAMSGDTPVPENAEEEVDYHYVCFTKDKSGGVIELDGDRKGPIDRGVLLNQDDDMLSEAGTEVVRRYIERERDQNIGFNLMALVREPGSIHSTV